jgi:hypothetical protein
MVALTIAQIILQGLLNLEISKISFFLQMCLIRAVWGIKNQQSCCQSLPFNISTFENYSSEALACQTFMHQGRETNPGSFYQLATISPMLIKYN